MNALNRLLAVGAVVAVSTASVPDLWPQLGPQAELWQLPVYLRQIDRLFDEADALDGQHALLRRLRGAREQVIEALRAGRLTAHQAVARFRELDAIRTESSLGSAHECNHKSPSENARLEVLGWLRQSLHAAPSAPDDAAVHRVISELNAPSTCSNPEGRLQ